MKSPFNSDFKLGILGGGQLGRMLLQSTVNFNVYTTVLDPDPEAPCRDLCSKFYTGSLTEPETVYQFGREVDLLTIEIENVNADAMHRLQREGVLVYPQPLVVQRIQDKGEQKLFFREHDIPTPEFFLVHDKQELLEHAHFFPAMQKLRRTGYDGRGVTKLISTEDLVDAFDAPSVVERFVPIEKEISVIVARNSGGAEIAYPAVEMMFHPDAHLVEFLRAPAELSQEIALHAEAIALRVVRALGLVGLAAVEMFVTEDQKVLVNEVAPRPHNSGHHTIEANVTSQYEQHLRAILNLPLGSTATKSPAIMVNILGAEEFAGEAKYEGMEEVLSLEGASVHLYGKKITRPFRKMGHVTILDSDPVQALAKARFVKDTLRVVA